MNVANGIINGLKQTYRGRGFSKLKSMNQQENKDKNIIQNIGYKEFSAICDEYRIVETATKNLLEIANNPETKTRFKVDIYKWIIEMNIGKPKQMEILSSDKDILINIKESVIEPKPLSAGVFIKWEEDNTEDILKNELISRGMTKEQIDTLIDEQLVVNDD